MKNIKEFVEQWSELISFILIMLVISILGLFVFANNKTINFIFENLLWLSIESIILIFFIEKIHTKLLSKKEFEDNNKITQYQRIKLINK